MNTLGNSTADTSTSLLSPEGLTSAEVQQRRDAGLTNTQDHSSSRSTFTIIRSHLFTLFNLILGLCGLAVVMSGRSGGLTLYCLSSPFYESFRCGFRQSESWMEEIFVGQLFSRFPSHPFYPRQPPLDRSLDLRAKAVS